MSEIRQAIRTLMSSPTTAVISICALSLGISVNVTMLISLNALLLHPFAYPEADRIMMISEHTERSDAKGPLSRGDFADLEKSHDVLDGVAAFRVASLNVRSAGVPDHVTGALVTPSFFQVFGLAPAAGSGALADKRSVVVSDSFWKSHMGSSPVAVGATIRVGGVNRVVTGVMPDSFDFPLYSQVWIPFDWTSAEQQDRTTRDLTVVARRQRGVSAAQAKARLVTIAQRAAKQYPLSNLGRSFDAISLMQWLVDDVTNRFVVVLCAAALFVLLLACVNVGNLHLARAAQMRKQIAVRMALGAGRLQTLRPFLIQNLALSIAASGFGLLLATWSNAFLRDRLPAVALQHVPGLRTMQIDGTVLLLTFGLTLLVALLCALPAAWYLLRAASVNGVNDWLQERSIDSAVSGKSVLRSGLIVAQLALAMVLLIGAGLMVQTFQHLLNRKQGFDPNNLLTAQLSLSNEENSEKASAKRVAFYDDFLRALSGKPGIIAAGIVSQFGATKYFQIEGHPVATEADAHPYLAAINAQYLAAMRIPLLAGRELAAGDRMESRHVAVISQSLARRYWDGRSPLGERLRLAEGDEWFTVVGVSGDVVVDWFSGVPQESVYVPYSQHPASWAEVDIRTAGDPMSQAQVLRALTEGVDADAALYELKSRKERSFEERFGIFSAAEMMTQFAAIALLLALTGVYGVISFFVAARTRDIGIRIALGASVPTTLAMIMRQTVQVLAIALAIGVPLSSLLARGMSHMLYGVVSVDEGTIAKVAALLSAAALLASLLPSWRATRIDPMVALREQ